MVEGTALELLRAMVEEADDLPPAQLDALLSRLLPGAAAENPAAARLARDLLRRTETVVQPHLQVRTQAGSWAMEQFHARRQRCHGAALLGLAGWPRLALTRMPHWLTLAPPQKLLSTLLVSPARSDSELKDDTHSLLYAVGGWLAGCAAAWLACECCLLGAACRTSAGPIPNPPRPRSCTRRCRRRCCRCCRCCAKSWRWTPRGSGRRPWTWWPAC